MSKARARARVCVYDCVYCMYSVSCVLSLLWSFVDHDLAQHGAVQTRPAISDAPRLYVHIATTQTTTALHMQTRFEQGIIKTCDETTSLVSTVQWLSTSATVDVDDEFVEVVRVVAVDVTVRASLYCQPQHSPSHRHLINTIITSRLHHVCTLYAPKIKIIHPAYPRF